MPNPPANPPATSIPPDPAAVHASALVIDAHADTPQRFVDESWDFTSPLAIADQPAGHLNLATARRGNLAAEFFALWPDPAQFPASATPSAPSPCSIPSASRSAAIPPNLPSAPRPRKFSPPSRK